jgi:fimbrial chaperone protein
LVINVIFHITNKGSFQINNFLKFIALSLLVWCFATTTYAGMFSVTPVRIYMTPQDKAVAVTITNQGDDELVMQADVYLWKQKPDGEDDLTLTEDMFLSPPIIKLAGKSHQVVRLARMNRAPSEQQLTYRLVVREIPEARPAKENIQLQIALAFSMPVFITPQGSKSKLDCVVERTAANSVNAVCGNTGNAYAQPLDFELTNVTGDILASRDKGGYILPSIKRSFDIKSADKNIPGGKAKLTVRLDDGAKQNYDVMLSE